MVGNSVAVNCKYLTSCQIETNYDFCSLKSKNSSFEIGTAKWNMSNVFVHVSLRYRT